ncbi:unnamed protein product [Ectocarpus sp. CCAP 1310/34]|nr:unnamed protein product [Ectocarpus sp. CCAP 1310/34]
MAPLTIFSFSVRGAGTEEAGRRALAVVASPLFWSYLHGVAPRVNVLSACLGALALLNARGYLAERLGHAADESKLRSCALRHRRFFCVNEIFRSSLREWPRVQRSAALLVVSRRKHFWGAVVDGHFLVLDGRLMAACRVTDRWWFEKAGMAKPFLELPHTGGQRQVVGRLGHQLQLVGVRSSNLRETLELKTLEGTFFCFDTIGFR